MNIGHVSWLRRVAPSPELCRGCGKENSCAERGCVRAREIIEDLERGEAERKALQECNAKMAADMKFLNERLAGLSAEVALRAPIPEQKEIALAVAYFADAVRESEEIMEHCSESMRKELEEQKAYFETMLRVVQSVGGMKL